MSSNNEHKLDPSAPMGDNIFSQVIDQMKAAKEEELLVFRGLGHDNARAVLKKVESWTNEKRYR